MMSTLITIFSFFAALTLSRYVVLQCGCSVVDYGACNKDMISCSKSFQKTWKLIQLLFLLGLWLDKTFPWFVFTIFRYGKGVLYITSRIWDFTVSGASLNRTSSNCRLATWRRSPVTQFWQQTADELHPIARLTLRAEGCCLAKIRRPIHPFSWLQLPPRKQSSLAGKRGSAITEKEFWLEEKGGEGEGFKSSVLFCFVWVSLASESSGR